MNYTNRADALTKLSAGTCDRCGEECGERFECGDAVCGRCYADAVGHGAMFDTAADACEATAAAMGRAVTADEAALVAAYF